MCTLRARANTVYRARWAKRKTALLEEGSLFCGGEGKTAKEKFELIFLCTHARDAFSSPGSCGGGVSL